MIRTLIDRKDCSFEWIDVPEPTEQEMEGLANTYHLHESSMLDCTQSGHLPKFEEFNLYTFIILRIYQPDVDLEADSVQELTNKVSLFITEKAVITVHRKPWPQLEAIAKTLHDEGGCASIRHLVARIIKAALHTYDVPGQRLTNTLETYERKVFLAERQVSLLQHLYYIKRKLDVIKRLLVVTYEVVEHFDSAEKTTATSRDVRDLYVKQKMFYDAASENVNQLLNIYFNISAQRTNDTMRVLTIFSVFFMPLTFIVGVYGMNFKYMPELDWQYSYPLVIASMAAIGVGIFWWF